MEAYLVQHRATRYCRFWEEVIMGGLTGFHIRYQMLLPKRESRDRSFVKQNTITTQIPTDVWLCIASFLPLSAIGSLALTCRYLFYCLSPLWRVEGWQMALLEPERKLFAQYLTEFFPEHVFCHACSRYHRPKVSRCGLRSFQTSSMHWTYFRAWDMYGTRVLSLDCEAWKREFERPWVYNQGLFQSWCIGFWVSFHLVMRAFRFGLEYGLPLSAIQQTRSRGIVELNPPPGLTGFTRQGSWKTDFRAVIVHGKLLVRERVFKIVKKHIWQNPYETSGVNWNYLYICNHHCSYSEIKKLQSLLDSLEWRVRKTKQSCTETKRCQYCPTEWQLQMIPKEMYLNHNVLIPDMKGMKWSRRSVLIVVTRYCDLGERRSPEELQWRSLTTRCIDPPLLPDHTDIKSRFLTAFNG